MLRCSDELIQIYVEGDLTAAERAVIEEHLTGCAACRRLAGIYKGLLWDLTQPLATPESYPTAEADPALAGALLAEWKRLHPAPSPSTGDLTLLWWRANPVAATATQSLGTAAGSLGTAAGSLTSAATKSLSLLWRRRKGGRS